MTKAGIKPSASNFKIKSHEIPRKHCFSGLFEMRLKVYFSELGRGEIHSEIQKC